MCVCVVCVCLLRVFVLQYLVWREVLKLKHPRVANKDGLHCLTPPLRYYCLQKNIYICTICVCVCCVCLCWPEAFVTLSDEKPSNCKSSSRYREKTACINLSTRRYYCLDVKPGAEATRYAPRAPRPCAHIRAHAERQRGAHAINIKLERAGEGTWQW